MVGIILNLIQHMMGSQEINSRFLSEELHWVKNYKYTPVEKEKAATFIEVSRGGVLKESGSVPSETKRWCEWGKKWCQGGEENRKKVSEAFGFKRCAPCLGLLSLDLSRYDWQKWLTGYWVISRLSSMHDFPIIHSVIITRMTCRPYVWTINEFLVGQATISNKHLLWPGALEISWVFIILISASLRIIEGGLALGCCPSSGEWRGSGPTVSIVLPALNLCIYLGDIAIITILSVLIYEHDACFHLFRPLISFSVVW